VVASKKKMNKLTTLAASKKKNEQVNLIVSVSYVDDNSGTKKSE
jgi:hypothetical protein